MGEGSTACLRHHGAIILDSGYRVGCHRSRRWRPGRHDRRSAGSASSYLWLGRHARCLPVHTRKLNRTVKVRNHHPEYRAERSRYAAGEERSVEQPRKKRAGAARYRTRLAMLKGAVSGRLVPQDLMSAISRCTDLDQSAGSLRFRTTGGIEYFPRESRSRHLLGRSCQRTPPVHFSNAHLASRLAPSTLCFTRKVNDHRSVVRSDGRPEFSCGNVRTPRRFGGRSL